MKRGARMRGAFVASLAGAPVNLKIEFLNLALRGKRPVLRSGLMEDVSACRRDYESIFVGDRNGVQELFDPGADFNPDPVGRPDWQIARQTQRKQAGKAKPGAIL